MAKRFSDKFKAAALALLDAGVSTREAQAQLKKRFRGEHVGEGTLRAWAKAAEASTAPEIEPSPAAVVPEPEPDPDDDSDDTYQHARKQLATAKRRADEAARDGNHNAAQRFSKQVVEYTLLLARLDKNRKSDEDAVVIPRAELERTRQALRERIVALASDLKRTGGLKCSNCGREIRIALAKGETDK